MAQRRMFSPQIVSSEEFLTLPTSTQTLYFHLGMNADDDGFIQPRLMMKTLGSSEDDLKVLLAKRFILPFESGVVVIKHWLIHNLIQKDRYRPTRFQEEKNMLFIKENKAYTDNPDSVNKLLPQVRLGEVRLLGNSNELRVVSDLKEEEPQTTSKPKYPNAKTVFSWFPKPQKSWLINTTELKHAELLFERGEKRVRGALEFVSEHEGEDFFPKVLKPSDLERKWTDLGAFQKKL